MTKPEERIEWATNVNYAGGPDVGTVTKVEPTLATEEDGWRGNQIPPPQFQNNWQNAVFQHLEWLRGLQIATLLQDADQRTLTIATPAFPEAIFSDGSFYYATGFSFAGGIVRSEDGIRNWRVPTTPAGVATADVIAADGAGVVLGGNAGGEIIRSTDFGDTYVIAEAAGSITTDDIIAMIWSAVNSLFIAISATDEIFTSPTGANGTWALRTTPAGAAGLAGHMAIATANPVFGRIAMANTAGSMFSDNAIDWTQVNFTGGGANGGVCIGWTTASAGFYLVGTADGEVWISSNATSWLMQAADVGPTVGGTANDSFGQYLVSDDGATWAALILTTGAGAKRTYYYSFDKGVTWRAAAFHSPAQLFHSIYFRDGRFYLGHGDNDGQIYNTPATP